MSITLGDQVTDSITGITGIATARHEYLYGCVRYSVEFLNGGTPALEYVDEQRLTSTPTATSGGPQSAPNRSRA